MTPRSEIGAATCGPPWPLPKRPVLRGESGERGAASSNPRTQYTRVVRCVFSSFRSISLGAESSSTHEAVDPAQDAERARPGWAC